MFTQWLATGKVRRCFAVCEVEIFVVIPASSEKPVIDVHSCQFPPIATAKQPLFNEAGTMNSKTNKISL